MNMNEFIKKLIEGLEELADGHAYCHGDTDYQQGIDNGTRWFKQEAISIVNQLAEEYNNKPVKTNADYIRSLSDEELADMLHTIGSCVNDGEPLISIWIGEKETTLDDSFGDILDWLKAEREG